VTSDAAASLPKCIPSLIYLEAGYAYAYYDAHAAVGDPPVDMAVARKQMEQLNSRTSVREQKAS
jgi:hypothetical protein